MKRQITLMIFVWTSVCALAVVTTFEDLTLLPESHWGGPGSGVEGFTSGAAWFPHKDSGYSWDGFLYSNETDTATPGYENQFSAITGGGVSGSANYGIGYVPPDWLGGTYNPIPQVISLTGDNYNTTISGMWVTNTTYAYLAMRDGLGPAKKFGGVTGNEEDWFKLIITGITENAAYTEPMDFYLADFRFADNGLDYILDDWTWVDLSVLGNVVGLEFSFASSDTGDYGINTPTYFAMDDLNRIPEPTTLALLGLGAVLLRKKSV